MIRRLIHAGMESLPNHFRRDNAVASIAEPDGPRRGPVLLSSLHGVTVDQSERELSKREAALFVPVASALRHCVGKPWMLIR